MSSLLGPFEKVKVEQDFWEKALNDFQCCHIVNNCDFMIYITIDVTYVLVKRCFVIELIPSSSDERDAIQKKTFTKWVNKHLKKVTIDNWLLYNNVGMENKEIFRKASILMQFCKTMW